MHHTIMFCKEFVLSSSLVRRVQSFILLFNSWAIEADVIEMLI